MSNFLVIDQVIQEEEDSEVEETARGEEVSTIDEVIDPDVSASGLAFEVELEPGHESVSDGWVCQEPVIVSKCFEPFMSVVEGVVSRSIEVEKESVMIGSKESHEVGCLDVVEDAQAEEAREFIHQVLASSPPNPGC